jgi:FKBP-type peptidyl-prolyl cis-trans isomerase
MKKAIVILAVSPLVLTSCFLDRPEAPKITIKTTSGEVTINSFPDSTGALNTPSAVKKEIVSSGDKIGVDYVGTLEDGTVFDSSLEEFAKKTKNYTPGARKYEPLSFVVGAGQMIKGFDA